MNKSILTKGNGLEATRNQPAKTLTKYAHDFIAYCASVKSFDWAFCLTALVLFLQVILMALPGVFQ